jgi:hypothetical protein
MTGKSWLGLGPSLLVAVGIIVATFVAVRAAGYGSWVVAGPLLLALAILGADMLASHQRGTSAGPSWPALFLAGACMLAGLIITLREPSRVAEAIPLIGMASWITLVRLPRTRTKTGCDV